MSCHGFRTRPVPHAALASSSLAHGLLLPAPPRPLHTCRRPGPGEGPTCLHVPHRPSNPHIIPRERQPQRRPRPGPSPAPAGPGLVSRTLVWALSPACAPLSAGPPGAQPAPRSRPVSSVPALNDSRGGRQPQWQPRHTSFTLREEGVRARLPRTSLPVHTPVPGRASAESSEKHPENRTPTSQSANGSPGSRPPRPVLLPPVEPGQARREPPVDARGPSPRSDRPPGRGTCAWSRTGRLTRGRSRDWGRSSRGARAGPRRASQPRTESERHASADF